MTHAEVIEVIDDDASVQVHVGPGSARLMFLGAGSPGRVIVVTIDRQARALTVYDVTEVRPATPGGTRAWKARQR